MQTVTLGLGLQHVQATVAARRNATEADFLQHWISMEEFFLDQARKVAAAAAFSYRGFNVGCVAYAYNPNAYYLEDCYRWFPGANFKGDADWASVCAEMVAVYAARSAGYRRMVGLAVVGPIQPDSESGLITQTLHPCGKCRRAITALPEVPLTTPVILGHLEDDGVVERYTFEQLLELHRK